MYVEISFNVTDVCFLAFSFVSISFDLRIVSVCLTRSEELVTFNLKYCLLLANL